jgi:hypothetical protein
MSLRTNLAIGAFGVLGFGTVCAVSAVNLDRTAAGPVPVQQVAAAPVAAEPVATGSIAPAAMPAPVPVKPRAPAPKEAKRDPAFDSERLAALLAAAAGSAKPITIGR